MAKNQMRRHLVLFAALLLVSAFQAYWFGQTGGAQQKVVALPGEDDGSNSSISKNGKTNQPFPSTTTTMARRRATTSSLDCGYPPINPLVLTMQQEGNSSPSLSNSKAKCVSPSSSQETSITELLVDIQDVVGKTDRNSRIPHMVHQTTMKSRCVVQELAQDMQKWQFPGYSYHLWDEQAVLALLSSRYDEFPGLKTIMEQCSFSRHIKATLWRYLVLYTYGGIYAELETIPGTFDPHVHLDSGDDAYFIVDVGGMLGDYFFAAAPGHPFLYYSIQMIVSHLYEEGNAGTIPTTLDASTSQQALGYFGLSRAMLQALKGGQNAVKPTKKKKRGKKIQFLPGTFQAGGGGGNNQTTVRIIANKKQASDDGDDDDDSKPLIERVTVSNEMRAKWHQAMNMTTHLTGEAQLRETKVSCMNALMRLQRTTATRNLS